MTDSDDDVFEKLRASGEGLIRSEGPFLDGAERSEGVEEVKGREAAADEDDEPGEESSSGRTSSGTVAVGGDGPRLS